MTMMMKSAAILVSLLSIGGLIVLLQYTKPSLLLPGDAIQITALAVLVIVTVWYAFSTHRIQEETAKQVSAAREQTEMSRQAVEIALNAEKNSVVPIVKLTVPGMSGTVIGPGKVRSESVRAHYSNIGKGPALNLRVWLRYDPKEFGPEARSNVKLADALGAASGGSFEWHLREESLPLPSNQYSGYDIVALYMDIYGQGFRSELTLINERDREFSFGRIPSVEN